MMAWRRSRQQRLNFIVFAIILCSILYLFGFFGFEPRDSSDQHEQPEFPDVVSVKPVPVKPPPAKPPPVKPPPKKPPPKHGSPKPEVPGKDDVEMVVASMKKENVTWLEDYLLEWKKNIYVVDDPKAKLTVPLNKGREAMVFLTYIIDRYDTLPGNIIFHHAERFQWHNDNPDYDALPLLQRFRFEHLHEQGYVNLRCVWVLGCPAEIHPKVDDVPGNPDEPIHARHVYKHAFQEIFPEYPVPEDIGVTCCSQFAARRETIWARPKADYIRYREWLTDSTLPDDLSGRVLEYAWHIIFGKKSVHCPAAGDCYCKTYGFCDLDCDTEKCPEQYTLPPFSTLPEGWPKFGWAHEDRGWKGLP